MELFVQGLSPPESKQNRHHVLFENQPAYQLQFKKYIASKDLIFAVGSEFTEIASSFVDHYLETEETMDQFRKLIYNTK